MTPERWQKIGDLFEEALALPANERSAMIDRVAASDKQVREEVLSLLASHHAVPGGFVQKRIQSAVESFHRTSATAEGSPGRAPESRSSGATGNAPGPLQRRFLPVGVRGTRGRTARNCTCHAAGGGHDENGGVPLFVDPIERES